MAGRTVPLTAQTKDWPRRVSDELRRVGARLDTAEASPAPALVKFIPTTEPAAPEEGWAYMDSVTHKLRVYDGSAWQNCW